MLTKKDAVSQERALTCWSKIAVEGMERKNAHTEGKKWNISLPFNLLPYYQELGIGYGEHYMTEGQR